MPPDVFDAQLCTERLSRELSAKFRAPGSQISLNMELIDSSKCTRLMTSASMGAMLTVRILLQALAPSDRGIVSVTISFEMGEDSILSTDVPESTG